MGYNRFMESLAATALGQQADHSYLEQTVISHGVGLVEMLMIELTLVQAFLLAELSDLGILFESHAGNLYQVGANLTLAERQQLFIGFLIEKLQKILVASKVQKGINLLLGSTNPS